MPEPLERIMVYVDGSEKSLTAAGYAITLARQTGARLTALYVINTRALNDLVKARIFLDVEQEEYQQDLEGDAERYLNYVEKMAADKGMTIEREQRSGTVHQEIVNAVQERDIDLLLIGQLTRIRSRRDEFYDETERAMRAVNCSVTIVKDEDKVWDLYDAL